MKSTKMNKEEVVKKLKLKYPGKKIVLNNDENPKEIICEIDPTQKHPKYSACIAVIDESLPHYHKQTTEIYEVIKGKLILNIGDKVVEMKEGDKIMIEPNKIHWSKGKETWVKTTSHPGWSPKDHFNV